MVAVIVHGREYKKFYLDENCDITSHYAQTPIFDSHVEEAFFHRFSKRKTAWKILREAEIVDLGDTVSIPDFQFMYASGQTALLEIVRFWTPGYRQKNVDRVNRTDRQD